MNKKSLWALRFLGVLACVAFLSGCAGHGKGTSDQGMNSAAGSSVSAESARVSGSGRVATGTQGDTLKGCIARIPSDASAGQRMLAEESCNRDEANRKSILAVPGQ